MRRLVAAFSFQHRSFVYPRRKTEWLLFQYSRRSRRNKGAASNGPGALTEAATVKKKAARCKAKLRNSLVCRNHGIVDEFEHLGQKNSGQKNSGHLFAQHLSADRAFVGTCAELSWHGGLQRIRSQKCKFSSLVSVTRAADRFFLARQRPIFFSLDQA